MMRTESRTGFNLIELAVVTAVVLSAAVIFYRNYNRAIMRSLIESASERGRDLYRAISEANAERARTGLSPVWPVDTAGNGRPGNAEFDFKNSTDYFRHLIGDGICRGVGYDCLAAGGITTCLNGHLTSSNNMWTVVKNYRSTAPDTLPILVTRNLDLSVLVARRKGAIRDRNLCFLPGDDWPFGRGDCLVIRKGGSAFWAHGRSLTFASLFGPDFDADAYNKAGLQPLKYLTPRREVVPVLEP